jgi:hypothetical protein
VKKEEKCGEKPQNKTNGKRHTEIVYLPIDKVGK